MANLDSSTVTKFYKDGSARVLVETFGGYRKHIAALTALGFVSAFLDGIGISAVVPLLSFLMGNATLPGDFVTSSIQAVFAFFGVPFKFRYLFFLIISVFTLRAFALIAFSYLRAYIAADFMKKEMSHLLTATLRSQWSFLLQQKAGYLQNTIYWDIRRTQGLLEVIAQFIQSWSGFIVYFVIAFLLSPLITVVTALAGGILLLVLRPLVQKTKSIGEETSDAEKEFSHLMVEHLGGLKSVKAAGAETAVLDVGESYLSRFQSLFTRNAVVQALGTVIIQPVSLIFILIVFGFLYVTGNLNIAVFVALLYLIQKIFLYLQSGQGALHSINQFVPFAESVVGFKKRLRQSREESVTSGRNFRFSGELTFDNVYFAYDGDKPVLSGLSFRIPKGTLVGLVGSSGAGKTSIADLILRLFTPTAGDILVDGVSIREIRLDEWRSHIGYVPQDSFLLNDTVFENIRFYRPTVSREDVIEALKQANVLDVVEALPDGLGTRIGDRGVLLSGGQRQRLVLARALAGKPDILILDEATSALDNESERLIQESIFALRGHVTVFVIAHRLSTVMRADTILVLERGKLVESGAPEQLLTDPSSYFARMYHS